MPELVLKKCLGKGRVGLSILALLRQTEICDPVLRHQLRRDLITWVYAVNAQLTTPHITYRYGGFSAFKVEELLARGPSPKRGFTVRSEHLLSG